MNGKSWNNLIATFPEPHVLQTWEWGKVKGYSGWHSIPIIWTNVGKEYIGDSIPSNPANSNTPIAAALVLERNLRIPATGQNLRIMYVPKGPLLLDWSDDEIREIVLDGLKNLASRRGAIFIKIDPDVRLGLGKPGEVGSQELAIGEEVQTHLKFHGWRISDEQIQFRNSIMIDLSILEDELLAKMKQKTRYNIRLAARKGVTVRPGLEADFPLLYKMYAETANRDKFIIRDEGYYINAWKILLDAGMANPLVAEVDGDAVAGLINIYFSKKAWYLFGMSSQKYREKMPNYLLQWTAIQCAKEHGCKIYDLWGAPDSFNEHDPMWGVFRFKVGLGGYVVRHIGAWDLPIQPTTYKLYTRLLPRILDLMRGRGRVRVRKSINAIG